MIQDSREIIVGRQSTLTRDERKVILTENKVCGRKAVIDNGTRGLQLTTEDLQTLDGSNWLNDMVVNQYLNLVQQRNDTDTSLPKILVMETFVYNVLDEDGLEEGERRMEGWFKIDLRTKDLIICPINKNLHWTIIILDINRKRINCEEEINFRIKIRQDFPV